MWAYDSVQHWAVHWVEQTAAPKDVMWDLPTADSRAEWMVGRSAGLKDGLMVAVMVAVSDVSTAALTAAPKDVP